MCREEFVEMSEETTKEHIEVYETIQVFFLLDTSASMVGEKMRWLNLTMAEALSILEDYSKTEHMHLSISVVEYNSLARWSYGCTEHGAEHIDWQPIADGYGSCNMAQAIGMVRNALKQRCRDGYDLYLLPPVVILVTGSSSNNRKDTLAAIEALKRRMKLS